MDIFWGLSRVGGEQQNDRVTLKLVGALDKRSLNLQNKTTSGELTQSSSDSGPQ